MVINVDGLTLRDYFAAMAMQDLLASESETYGLGGEHQYKTRAEKAYVQADAMLKVRENG